MNATSRQTWLRLALVLAMALSWLGASVGCAFGLPCPQHPTAEKACPGCCEDQSAPESGTKGACCVIDVSPTPGSASLPMAQAVGWTAWVGEVVRSAAAEQPGGVLVADTGPPERARSFAELVLGRSRLEHAPPARG